MWLSDTNKLRCYEKSTPEIKFTYTTEKPTVASCTSLSIDQVIPYSAIIGRGKILAKSLPWKNGREYLANLYPNKTICAYIINNYCSEVPNNSVLEVFDSKKYFTKLLHVCNWADSVVVSMFEFTVNKALHLAFKKCGRWKQDKGWLVIATTLMLAITESITGKWFSHILKDKNDNNLTIQGLVQVWNCNNKCLLNILG